MTDKQGSKMQNQRTMGCHRTEVQNMSKYQEKDGDPYNCDKTTAEDKH